MAPIRDYVTLLKQLGASTPVTLQQRVVPRGGPELLDEESSDDGRLLQTQAPNVALFHYSLRYTAYRARSLIQDEGTIPPGFSPITVAGHQCYTNGKPKEGTAWYSDGSKLEVPSLEGQADRAGVALSCQPLIIIARVTGPQTSYRGELQGAALVTACALAEPGDTLTMDNQAVVRWAPRPPHWECADMDLRQQVAEHLAARPIPFSWVPSHRSLSDATSPDDRETILRNDEVDRWAKTATALPLPPCEPTEPSAIVICGGIPPTPAKKWVLQRRRTFGFPGVHWVSWLPLKGTKRMLWLRWP